MEPNNDYRFVWKANPSGIVPAVILIGIGALFLLNNLNIFHVYDLWKFWPVTLIAGGVFKLVDSPLSSGRAMGGVLFGAGALILADNLGFLHLTWDAVWPIALIGAGLAMLWHRLSPADVPWAGATPPFRAEPGATPREGALNEFTMFGGVNRKVTTADFRGGQIAATFGGVEVDLRRAGMVGDAAAIELNVMFGGVEIKVPENWSVVSEIPAMFGGVENKSMQPPEGMPGVKRLYVKGFVMFGGVTIKN
jgi:predicted membrane protein